MASVTIKRIRKWNDQNAPVSLLVLLALIVDSSVDSVVSDSHSLVRSSESYKNSLTSPGRSRSLIQVGTVSQVSH